MTRSKAAAAIAALAIGIAQMYLLTFCWNYIAVYNPLPSWLIGHGVIGSGLKVSLFATDFCLSVLLCIPAAALLLHIRPRHLQLHLPLAVIPACLWQYRLLLSGVAAPVGFTSYLPGMLSQLLVLPVAVGVLLVIRASVAPNNSFKPKPHRGSA